jgi:enoyl-[acyl-carrier protein] reductase II
MMEFANAQALYFGGDMEASIALSGQVAGRINAIKPAAQIIDDIVAEYLDTVHGLAASLA